MVMHINVRVPLQLISLSAPYLSRTQGAVVNVSASPVPRPQCSIFSISKSCVDMLSKCAALELANSGIRVNSVAPGAVDTPVRMNQPFGPLSESQNEAFMKEMAKKIPLQSKMPAARDIANVVLFLANRKSSYINGQVLTVDGGSSLATQGCWIEWNAIEGNFGPSGKISVNKLPRTTIDRLLHLQSSPRQSAKNSISKMSQMRSTVDQAPRSTIDHILSKFT